MGLKPIAGWVHPDEPAWGLVEAPMMVPQAGGGQSSRWIQQIKVIRDDHIAYYTRDLGPAGDFKDVTPLIMPSVGTDTVAQLQEFADKNRQDDHWAKRARELQEGSTLIEDHVMKLERERELFRNRSHIGPAISVQRNEVPIEAIRRKARDARNR